MILRGRHLITAIGATATAALFAAALTTATRTPEPAGVATATATAPASACTRTGYSRGKFGNQPSPVTRAALWQHARPEPGDPYLDPYTGQPYTTGTVDRPPPGLDADHVVALADAWDRGACQWSTGRRVLFASDIHYLRLVAAGLNRSKGDQPLTRWHPPAGACAYATTYLDALTFWRLRVDQADRDRLKDLCQ